MDFQTAILRLSNAPWKPAKDGRLRKPYPLQDEVEQAVVAARSCNLLSPWPKQPTSFNRSRTALIWVLQSPHSEARIACCQVLRKSEPEHQRVEEIPI